MLRLVIASCLFLSGFITLFPVKAEAFDFTPLDAVVEKAIEDGVFPGASLAVLYKGRIVFHKAFGRQTYERRSTPVDTTTMYDVASLTKAVATTSIAMQLWERDSLNIDLPVARYMPAFGKNGKSEVTIRQLMLHTSGLRAHTFFYKTCRTPDEVLGAICSDTLLSAPGRTMTYSDLGFIVLGRIIETITGNSLAVNFHSRFSLPLAMSSTLFNPAPSLLAAVAPTERDTTWHFTNKRPLVNDQNAALLGGIAGHAGLFSTTGDLLKFTSMMMKEGSLGNRQFFKPSTVHIFTSRTGNASRALGWDLRSPEGSSSAGECFSAKSWGHLGYTGTSIWVDPEKELAVILLSNRVWPTSENIKIRKFRPLLHDTVASCLGFRKL